MKPRAKIALLLFIALIIFAIVADQYNIQTELTTTRSSGEERCTYIQRWNRAAHEWRVVKKICRRPRITVIEEYPTVVYETSVYEPTATPTMTLEPYPFVTPSPVEYP